MRHKRKSFSTIPSLWGSSVYLEFALLLDWSVYILSYPFHIHMLIIQKNTFSWDNSIYANNIYWPYSPITFFDLLSPSSQSPSFSLNVPLTLSCHYSEFHIMRECSRNFLSLMDFTCHEDLQFHPFSCKHDFVLYCWIILHCINVSYALWTSICW